MRRRSSDFTLRQLDTFVCAARSGSFALAADQLGITQPAVSDHITTLERHLGHRLFDRRRGTTPVLTRQGVDMLHRAESLLSTSQAMRGEENGWRTEDKVHIRLSIGTRSRDAYLKPLLARIYTELPHVELEIVPPLPASEAIAALEKREVDLILYTVGRPTPPLPNSQLLGDVPIHLVAAPEMAALLNSGALTLDDLQFILPDFGMIADQWLERQLSIVGIRPRRPVRYLEYGDVIQGIVEDGLGVSVLMEEQVAAAIATGRLVRFGPALEPMRRIIARSALAPRATELLERLLIKEITGRSHIG